MASTLHISISAETIAKIGALEISNSMLTSLIASSLLIAFALLVRSQLRQTGRPTMIQNLAEMIIEALYNLVESITNSTKRTKLFFPLVATFFLFILLNNWLGLFPGVGTIGILSNEEHAAVELMPQVQAATPAQESVNNMEVNSDSATDGEYAEGVAGGVAEKVEGVHEGPTFVPLFRAGTADLNTTIALALVSVVATQAFGFQFLHLGYLKKYLNFDNPITFFVGILETILEFAKIISFAFRLFGNIFAGEVLLAVISFLVPVIAPMPFYGLEIIVGVIQALVFALLSVVFFNMATVSHDDH